MLDQSYIGESNRLAPEAPVPVVKIKNHNHYLGGCGNVINNLAAFGIDTTAISVIGSDEPGRIIKNLLSKINIDTKMIIMEESRVTTLKTRTFVNDKLISRNDTECTRDISAEIIDQIKEFITANIKKYNIIVLSDYTKGVLTYDLTQFIIKLANQYQVPVFVDPKDKDYMKYYGCTLIKPNKIEAEAILNQKITIELLQQSMHSIIIKLNCQICLLTLGELGLSILDQYNNFSYIKSTNKKVIDVTGAGDTVLAGFCYYYLKSRSINESAHFANYCGHVKVNNVGTYTIKKMDIINYRQQYTKLIDKEELQDIIRELKNNNQKIVFTNGCFDIIHYGHLICLETAKKFGDILIVGLNCDEYIAKTKGKNRPYNCLKYRIKQLEMLTVVDFIVVFSEDTPLETIKIVQPDVLVKGGDYRLDQVVGSEYARTVKVLTNEYVPNISSTGLIRMMQQ